MSEKEKLGKQQQKNKNKPKEVINMYNAMPKSLINKN